MRVALVAFILFISSTSTVFSQYNLPIMSAGSKQGIKGRVFGKVVNEKDNAVDFATVLLMRPVVDSITKSINVVDEDVEAFKKLDEKGVRLVSQMVPNDRVEQFMSLLNK